MAEDVKEMRVSEEVAILMAKEISKARYKISNPPPWLICSILHRPYTPA